MGIEKQPSPLAQFLCNAGEVDQDSFFFLFGKIIIIPSAGIAYELFYTQKSNKQGIK